MITSAAQMVSDATASVPAVTAQEAHDELRRGGVVVLDVREPVEWEQHIEGCVQVPRGILEFSADPTSPRHDPRLDPRGRVIVYCRSGARSALACRTLVELGFTDVANLAGGFTAWKAAGLPVTDTHDGI
jgi:rhodanese-related sulfurtransferase